MKLPAFQILAGDMIDLEGDPYADPNHDNSLLECELIEVDAVEDEGGGCIAIYFDGFDAVGFPRNHLLTVTREQS